MQDKALESAWSSGVRMYQKGVMRKDRIVGGMRTCRKRTTKSGVRINRRMSWFGEGHRKFIRFSDKWMREWERNSLFDLGRIVKRW
jgi:hypothetical protein